VFQDVGIGCAKVLRLEEGWLPKSCERLRRAGVEEVNGRRVQSRVLELAWALPKRHWDITEFSRKVTWLIF
jgi:hypothetical protein